MGQRLEDIKPRRVSLVKRGANLRRILLAKADGEVDADIAEMLAVPAPHETVLLKAVRESDGDESVEKAAAAFARASAALADAYDGDIPEAVEKAMRSQALDADADDEDENDDAPEDEDEGDDDELLKAEVAVYKRDFSAQERRDLAAKGQALQDGSYPIPDKDALGRAITLAQSGHGDAAAAKALIKRRASELGATDALPDDWKVNKEDSMTETAQAVPVKKEDGSWDLSAVPEEQRAAFEAVIKAQDDELAELRKQAETEATKAEEAERIAKSVQEKIEKAEHVEKAKGYANLAKSADEIGSLLYSVAKAEENDHLPEGTFKALDELLSAANEAAADVFKTAGRIGHSTGNEDALSKIEAKADEIRKADSSLSKEQAFARALDQNPDLYDEYQKAVA